MKATITNLILEGSRFRVFVRFDNGVEEMNVFQPEATAEDIKAWVLERITYYEELLAKEEALKEELINLELPQ